MELKEARELAELIRQQSVLSKGLRTYTAIVTLDDRITELVKAGTARTNALDGLLVCYRLGKRPSEKLFDQLTKSGIAWEKAKGE